MRHHIVRIAMDNEETRTILRNIGDGADKAHHLGHVSRCPSHEGRLGRVAILHGLTILHAGHVHRAKPIDHGIHPAALIGVSAHGTLQIDRGSAHRAALHPVGHTGQCREMPTGRETGDAYERSVQPVSVGIGTQVAYGRLHIMYLGRKPCIATTPVVDAHHGKSRIRQGLAYRHVGHPLHIVGKPGTSIDGHHHLVALLIALRQVDVHLVSLQLIVGIVHILVLRFHTRTSKPLRRLGISQHSATDCRDNYSQSIHMLICFF